MRELHNRANQGFARDGHGQRKFRIAQVVDFQRVLSDQNCGNSLQGASKRAPEHQFRPLPTKLSTGSGDHSQGLATATVRHALCPLGDNSMLNLGPTELHGTARLRSFEPDRHSFEEPS